MTLNPSTRNIVYSRDDWCSSRTVGCPQTSNRQTVPCLDNSSRVPPASFSLKPGAPIELSSPKHQRSMTKCREGIGNWDYMNNLIYSHNNSPRDTRKQYFCSQYLGTSSCWAWAHAENIILYKLGFSNIFVCIIAVVFMIFLCRVKTCSAYPAVCVLADATRIVKKKTVT